MHSIIFVSIFYLLLFNILGRTNLLAWGLSYNMEREGEHSAEIILHANANKRKLTRLYYTTKDVEHFAYLKGMLLKPTVQGIYITVDAYPVDSEVKIGYLSAFLRPIPKDTLHFETIQIRGSTQNPSGEKVVWPQENGLISFILSSWALCWATEKGSTRAELLVKKDSNQMYRILTRLYTSFGFEILQEVERNDKSITDQMIWGGTGSVMVLSIDSFFEKWTKKFLSMMKREEKKQGIQ